MSGDGVLPNNGSMIDESLPIVGSNESFLPASTNESKDAMVAISAVMVGAKLTRQRSFGTQLTALAVREHQVY